MIFSGAKCDTVMNIQAMNISIQSKIAMDIELVSSNILNMTILIAISQKLRRI